MAPRKPIRTVEHERYLAERIRDTRLALDWSLENLALRMTNAGCPLDKSAIHRIEQGSPPRRITLDEAVTFANVFGMQLDDLLLPAAVARSQEAAEAWRGYVELSARYSKVRDELNKKIRTLVGLVATGHDDAVLEGLKRQAVDGALRGSERSPEEMVQLLKHLSDGGYKDVEAEELVD